MSYLNPGNQSGGFLSYLFIILIGLASFSNVDAATYYVDAANGSDSANNGSIIGGASWVSGQMGNALNFNGTNSSVDIAHNSILNPGTGDFSITFWMKTTSTGSATLVGKNPYLPNGYAVYYANSIGGIKASMIMPDNTTYVIQSTETVTDNQWHFITATFNRTGNIILYIDGTQKSTITMSGSSGINVNPTNPLRIGNGGGSYFSGNIDDVRLYSEALTSQNISDLYTGTNISSGMIMRLSFDEGSGSIAFDTLGNNGSIGSPFQTIQKSVNTAIAGDTIYVRNGTYREDIEAMIGGGSAGNYVNIFAYNTEKPVLKGSQVVTGWIPHSGNIWKKIGWTTNSQQVFVDFDTNPNSGLQQIGMPSSYFTTYEYPNQIGTGLIDMAPGRFYYETGSQTLYVQLPDNSDPNTHTMEASITRRIFYMGVPYFHLKGLTFRHNNGSEYGMQTTAVELSTGSIIEDCDIQYSDFGGLAMGYNQSGAIAINNIISNNGGLGIGVANAENFTIRGNIIQGNNTKNFNKQWHAGGIKVAGTSYGIVESNEVFDNNGTGIWFDYARSGNPIFIFRNYIHNNGPEDAGIFFEVSKNGLITNNIIKNNTRRAIYISASDDTRVYNNTIYGANTRAAIEVAGVPRSGATLTNNQVYNNTISESTTFYDLFYARDSIPNGSSNNIGDYNNIYRSLGLIKLSGDGGMPIYNSLSPWSLNTGLDLHSMSSNPSFIMSSPNTVNDFQLLSTSPLIDAGSSSATGAGIDFLGNPIYGTPDIGAYEYQPPHRVGIDKVDISAGARIYGDGKFRDLLVVGSGVADLSVMPASGSFPLFNATDTRPEWMDISITTWSNTGTYYKEWIESSTIGSIPTLHTIGDLKANTSYIVVVDGTGSSIVGTGSTICSSGNCMSDASGSMMFIYTGGYSTHTFTITEGVQGDTTPPVITLIGSGTVIVPFGSGYTDLGATASDLEDGNLTSSIVVNNTVNTSIVGNYTVTYDVTDAQMNQAVRVTRVVNVVDTTPPVITLIGSGVVNIYQNGSYVDSGATWTDIVDGGGTISSATSGSVNVFLTGTYTLSYTHTDVAGNTGIPVTRVVNVIPVVSTGSTSSGSTGTGSTGTGSTGTGSTGSGSTGTGIITSTSPTVSPNFSGPGGGGGGGGGSSSTTSSNDNSSSNRNSTVTLSSAPVKSSLSTLSGSIIPVLSLQSYTSLSVQEATRVSTEYKESIDSLITNVESSNMRPMHVRAQQYIYGTFIGIWRDIARSSNPTGYRDAAIYLCRGMKQMSTSNIEINILNTFLRNIDTYVKVK